MKKIISQFIPIVIIFLLLSYSDEIAIFSHSILGKMISILIIGYYTVIDKYVGLLVCILFIFYYQTDYVESMLNINESMWDWRVDHDFVDDYSYLETFSETPAIRVLLVARKLPTLIIFAISSLLMNLLFLILVFPLEIDLFLDYYNHYDLYNILYYIYYISYAVNFYVLLLTNSLFRTEFFSILFRKTNKQENNRTHLATNQLGGLSISNEYTNNKKQS
jgi:hypothetical protein